jgi:two-component system sensor histidine kinase CiaH
MYEVVIDDEYYYKGMTIDLSETTESSKGYIQLLLNIDTEKELVQIYREIIVWSVTFGIIISVIASIIISRKSLNPVIEVLKKQNEFVANVSHELRTPLTIIQAKQELLLSDPDAKIIDKSEDISQTLNEAKRMSKITKDLMLLSRADNNQIVLQKEEVEIDEFIEGIAKTYSELIELENKKFVLNLEYKKIASIDTNKIYQVMVILLDNAMKYTEAGDTIEIHTYQKDNKCVIEVKDTGIGIGDEAIKHVFERFYREDKARSRETGGSGLGLSIADMIVSSHSGTIKASHNGEKGSVFTIKLPR